MMKVNKSFWLLAIIVLPMLFASCSRVPAGHKGIRVFLLGGDKGVDHEELGVGRYHIGINEELYIFPTFTQNWVWTADAKEGSPNNESITFQTVEGLSVNADIGISYHIHPDSVSKIFVKYRRGVDEITDVFLRNMVRDAFVTCSSTKKIESIYGTGKARLIAEVDSMVKSQVNDIGIVIEKIYYIGELRLPPTIVTALNNKIKATQEAQQRENEIAKAEAEAKVRIAEAEGEAKSILIKAKAEAEANRLLSQSISPTLVDYFKIEKWNGALPTYTGGNGMLFNMK